MTEEAERSLPRLSFPPLRSRPSGHTDRWRGSGLQRLRDSAKSADPPPRKTQSCALRPESPTGHGREPVPSASRPSAALWDGAGCACSGLRAVTSPHMGHPLPFPRSVALRQLQALCEPIGSDRGRRWWGRHGCRWAGPSACGLLTSSTSCECGFAQPCGAWSPRRWAAQVRAGPGKDLALGDTHAAPQGWGGQRTCRRLWLSCPTLQRVSGERLSQ